jgi:Outer membrane efflux protein
VSSCVHRHNVRLWFHAETLFEALFMKPTGSLRACGLPVFGVVAILLAAPAAAQVAPAASLTLQAAMDRALAANPTIAAARLTSAVNLAGLALARERPNPEATVEFEKETPKQAFGFALPVELGGKRSKRIDVSQATIRAGEAELAATIAQVRNDVRRSYFAVLVADARLTVLRELRDLSQRVRDAAQARRAWKYCRLVSRWQQLRTNRSPRRVRQSRREHGSTCCSVGRSTRRSRCQHRSTPAAPWPWTSR